MTSLVVGDDHSVFLDAMSAVLAQRGYEVTVADSVADTIEAQAAKGGLQYLDYQGQTVRW